MAGDTLWLADDGGRVHAIGADGAAKSSFQAHESAIWALAANGELVVTADKNGEVAMFKADGTEVGRLAGTGRPVRDARQ